MNSIFDVGIDIGSTTIKLVVLDHEKKIVYKNYARHFPRSVLPSVRIWQV